MPGNKTMVSRDVAIKVPRGKIIIFHFVLAMMDIMTMKLYGNPLLPDDKIIFYLKQTFKNIAKPDKINPREIILVNWTANSIVSLSKPYANNLTVCSVKTNIKRTITEEITNIMFMTLLVKAFAAFSPFCANMLLYMGINVVASPVPTNAK